MNRRVVSAFISTMVMVIHCLSVSAQPKLLSHQTMDYFSTVSALFLYCEPEQNEQFGNVWSHIKRLLADIDEAVSLSHPDSDISHFNNLGYGEKTAIRPLTAQMLSIAFDVYAQTDGLYDPTVYPLVDLWGFSPRFNLNTYQPSMPYDRAYINGRLPLPDRSHIDALLPLVGLSGIDMYYENGVWYLKKNTPPVTIDGCVIQAQLDFGGIAKGYACDLVKEYLQNQGYTMGYFVCGGSSMAILSHPKEDGLYSLTLGKPRPGKKNVSHYATIAVHNTMLSTSSDNTHAYQFNGIRYCHIINPHTGYPVNMPNDEGIQRGTASITLFAQNAARSDALTTALCLMPPQEAFDFIAQHLPQNLAVAALYQSDIDTIEVITNITEDHISIDDPAYIPASFTIATGETTYTGTFFSH
ncbi:MAG: FAD:protein FMN transferase [Christensenellales bacterium]